MLTATGLVESWDQTPTADGRVRRCPSTCPGRTGRPSPSPSGSILRRRPRPAPAPYSPLDGSRVAPLDGMRAFAVTAVILYHANPSWAVGGYFGVDVFFVLSGFLITTLLLGEWRGSGGVGLRAFWGRRARRLLPALFVMLAVVGCGVRTAAEGPGLTRAPRGHPGHGGLRGQLAFHLGPHQLLRHGGQPFPAAAHLDPGHRGAVLPDLAAGAPGPGGRVPRPTPAVGGQRRSRLVLVAGVAAAGAVASAVAMAALTPVGATSVNRAYYGSDTRAQGLLVGAALAAVVPVVGAGPHRARSPDARGGRPARRRRHRGDVADGARVLGADLPRRVRPAGRGHGRGHRLRHPPRPASRGRGCSPFRPLPYLGKISYGMYLWYWPVLLVMTSQRTHLHGVALLAARLAAIVAVAALSFHLVETPIHRGRLAGWRSLVAVPLGGPGRLAAPLDDAFRLGGVSRGAEVAEGGPPLLGRCGRPPVPCGYSWSATRWPVPSGWA